MATEENEKTVPYARFTEVRQEAKGLKTQVDTLTSELNKANESKAQVETLTKQLADATAAHDADRTSWADERGLVASGITDPDGQEVARLLYGKLPAEGKPKSIQDYVTGLRAEGAAVPKPLQPYLVAPAAAGGGTQPAKPPPNAAGGNGAQPGTGTVATTAELKAMRETATRSKSPADWKIWQDASTAALQASRKKA